MDLQRAERLALDLLRAMKPSLRSRLGDRATDREFIGELYVLFRRALSEYPEAEFCTPELSEGNADELALTAYLVAAVRDFGPGVDPELLEALRREIAGVLSGSRPPEAGEAASGMERP